MTLLKSILPAIALSFVVFTPASAMTPAASVAIGLAQAADNPVVEIQHRRRAHSPRVHRGPPPRHRYVPGQRYRSAPPGWRQHRARPGDWRTRGCVMVGPLWFCP